MLPYLDYNTDPLRNRMVYGTVYADQLNNILKKNSGTTLKRDLKPGSRIVNTMSIIHFAEKLKDILFLLLKQFHGNHAIMISSILIIMSLC